jgi:hypothetical protein
MWTEGDHLLSKDDLLIYDDMKMLSYSLDSLVSGVYPKIPGIPIKKLESKRSKVHS